MKHQKKDFTQVVCVALLVLVVLLNSQTIYGQKDFSSNKGFKTLFNGKNWDGWHLKIRSGDDELAKKVFSIEKGIVHVYKHQPDSLDLDTGKNATHGLFYTNKKYSKYILRFEYKWGKKITNNFKQWQYDAGCYYHVVDDKIWPVGVEYQVRYNPLTNNNHSGDLIISGVKAQWFANEKDQFALPKDGGLPKTYDKWLYLASPEVTFNALNDKWNQCEIIVMGDSYTIHKLNGKIVNMASNLSVSEGIIGFQSETAEIYYRNIKIKEFDAIIPIEKFLSE